MKGIKFMLSAVLLALSVSVSAQNITVKGTVKDAQTGDPVPAAAVMIDGSTSGVVTDFDGAYSIAVASDGVLVFSSIGYETMQVEVKGQKTINVELTPSCEFLDETLVVAYGTAKKSSYSGSASMVRSEDLMQNPVSSVEQALQGKVAGLQVSTASGQPGATTSFRIRGTGTLNASAEPLYVIDGVATTSASYSPMASDVSNDASIMATINPQDIESITVLKDAAAASLYGSRAANGVVIITTKKGKTGDAQVKFDGRWGVNSRLIPQYDVIDNPAQYYETFYQRLYNQYYYSGHSVAESYAYANKYLLDEANGGLGYLVYTVPEGQNLVGSNFKLNPNATLGYYDGEYYYTPDDWYKEAFHNAFRQEYNVSAAGGSNRFNYYASVGFLQNSGIVNNSDYKRYTGRVNAEYQAKSWMRFTTSLNFSHSDSQSADWSDSYGSSGNLFYIANIIGPIYPLYVRKMDESGKPYIVTENGRILYDSNNTN